MKLRPYITYIVFFDCFLAEHLETTPFDDKIFTNNMNESKVSELHNQGVCVWGGGCVWGGVCLPIFARTLIWQNTNTPRTLKLLRTYTRFLLKNWLKTPKMSCFTIWWGEGSQHSKDFNGLHVLLYIYEDTRVLGSISNSQGCVCIW